MHNQRTVLLGDSEDPDSVKVLLSRAGDPCDRITVIDACWPTPANPEGARTMTEHRRQPPPEPIHPRTSYLTDAPIEAVEGALVGHVVQYDATTGQWTVDDPDSLAYDHALDREAFADRFQPIHDSAVAAAMAAIQTDIKQAASDWTGEEVTQ